MATTNVRGASGAGTLDGWFKKRYGIVQKVVPKLFTLQRMFKFSRSEILGDEFSEVALLQNEHGVTYAAPTEDAYALLDPVAGQTKPTKIQGSQHVMRTYIGINALASAKSKGPAAFGDTMSLVIDNMNDSLRKRCEIDYFYGQDSAGLALVDSIATNTVTIAAADWAPGIWAGAEGAVLETFQTGFASKRTGTATVTSVDISARTVTASGGWPTNTAATDIILFKGMHDGSAWKTCLGLKAALSVGAGSTLFNLSTDFSLWRPSTYSAASGQLTFQKVQKAGYKAFSKGFRDNMKLVCNPTTWADVLNDEVALRRHNQGGVRRYDVGSKGVMFYTAIGTISIEASIYCKEGVAFMIPDSNNKGWQWRRIGSRDVGFDPIGDGGRWIERVKDTAAYEVRMYDNQAIYTGRPGYNILLSNIVNAT